MRFRRRYKRSAKNTSANSLREETGEGQEEVKIAKPVRPASLFRKIITNPNFNSQLMITLLTFASDNVQMDRRIDTMGNAVDKLRNISDVINNSMQSLRAAAETPKQIRRLLDQKSNK